jgi:hypothetical protein
MLYGQSGPVARSIASRTAHFQFHLQFAATVALFALLLGLSGCGGLATPASGSTPSASPSNSSLTIVPVPASASVGSTYNATLNVRGGTAPYLFSLVSGALPTGMSLNDQTGNISGTPTSAATFNFGVSVSDAKGLSKQQPLQIVVASSTGGNQNQAKSFFNLQQNTSWGSYGQGPPDFVDCSPSPCDGITYAMKQGVSSPSISGSSTRFDVGGTAIYSDALFNNHLIGAFSSQGLPDNNKTLVPAYHNFTYDVYFYGANLELSQAVEFDMNQFFDGLGFIWGHECRIAGGHEWDVWNNVTAHWTPTGIACNPVDNAWNHLTIQVQRTADNKLLYQSITLNGVTNQLNQYYEPGAAPGWYGITINYQMDGNYQQSPYSVYLDQLTFSYD